MNAVARGWVAFAAVGAGLVHLALALNAPILLGLLLVVVGVAEFAWGVLVMFDARFLVPRLALVAVLAPIGLWIAAIAVGLTIRPLPLALATVLELLVAFVLAFSLRRPSTAGVGTGRYVAGLAIAALVVGLITAPALAATEAGEQAFDPSLFDDGVHH